MSANYAAYFSFALTQTTYEQHLNGPNQLVSRKFLLLLPAMFQQFESFSTFYDGHGID